MAINDKVYSLDHPAVAAAFNNWALLLEKQVRPSGKLLRVLCRFEALTPALFWLQPLSCSSASTSRLDDRMMILLPPARMFSDLDSPSESTGDFFRGPAAYYKELRSYRVESRRSGYCRALLRPRFHSSATWSIASPFYNIKEARRRHLFPFPHFRASLRRPNHCTSALWPFARKHLGMITLK